MESLYRNAVIALLSGGAKRKERVILEIMEIIPPEKGYRSWLASRCCKNGQNIKSLLDKESKINSGKRHLALNAFWSMMGRRKEFMGSPLIMEEDGIVFLCSKRD
jgi:hypothetical protein